MSGDVPACRGARGPRGAGSCVRGSLGTYRIVDEGLIRTHSCAGGRRQVTSFELLCVTDEGARGRLGVWAHDAAGPYVVIRLGYRGGRCFPALVAMEGPEARAHALALVSRLASSRRADGFVTVSGRMVRMAERERERGALGR